MRKFSFLTLLLILSLVARGLRRAGCPDRRRRNRGAC